MSKTIFDTITPVYHSHDHEHDHDHGHDHNHDESTQTQQGRPSRSLLNIFRKNSNAVAPQVILEESNYDEEEKNSIRQQLNDIADKLKAVDGIDETANLVGQIFPGVVAPAVTAGILLVATPFVFLGIIGMKHEYEQAKGEMIDILESEEEVKDKLLNLAKFAKSKRKLLSDKLGLELKDDDAIERLETAAASNIDDNEFLQKIYEAETIANRKLIVEVSAKYGWSGVLGMSGMFAGMIPATLAATFEIVEKTSKLEPLVATMEVAAEVTGKVAGSFFLVGQVAMSAYATSRGVAGLRSKKILENSQENFESFAEKLSDDDEVARAVESVLQIFNKNQYFLDKTSIEYAKLTVAGQIFMGAGTICGLSGAGIAAAIPLFSLGAPLTIYPAIKRIVAQQKGENFSGAIAKNNNFVKEFISRNSISKMLEARVLAGDDNQDQEADRLNSSYKAVFAKNARRLNIVNENLAELKVISLVLHLVGDKKYKKKTPEQKLEILKKKLKIGKENLSLKSSNLEENIVKTAKDKFESFEEVIKEVLNLDSI